LQVHALRAGDGSVLGGVDLEGAGNAGDQSFLAHARENYDGGLPRYVEQELRSFLKCGVFSEGFTRARCDACGHDLLVAFSCHGRSICPSCCGRRMANGAAHLVDRVLPDVPVRQYVDDAFAVSWMREIRPSSSMWRGPETE
jgi:Transposase zinc-binding domain